MQPVSMSIGEVVHSVKTPGRGRLRRRRSSVSLRRVGLWRVGLGTWLGLCLGLVGCDDSEPQGSLVSPDPDFFVDPEQDFSGPTQRPPVAPNPEPVAVCDEQGTPEFLGDAVSAGIPSGLGQAVYTWIPDQVARALTPTLVPFDVPSNWTNALQQAAPSGSAALFDVYPELATSAAVVTWSNPWATRLLFEGSEQPRLLKLTLRDGLSWLSFVEGEPKLVDAFGRVSETPLAPAELANVAGVALLTPEPSDAGCQEPLRRLVIVTNPDAIVEWSVGDAASLTRVTTDVANVEWLMKWLRPCAPIEDASAWVSATACSQYAGSDSRVGLFERALALATPDYHPAPPRLAHLADTLKADLRAWNAAPLLVQSVAGQTTGPSDVDAGSGDSGAETGAGSGFDAGSDSNAANDVDASSPADDGGAATLTNDTVTAAQDAAQSDAQVMQTDVGESSAVTVESGNEASSSAPGTHDGGGQ